MNLLNKFTINGLLLSVIGLLYYANFRQPIILFDSLNVFSLLQIVNSPIILPSVVDEWLPSFIHILAMNFLTFGLLRCNKNYVLTVPIFWLVFDLLFEVLQNTHSLSVFSYGNFEWVDIIALCIGTILSIVVFMYSKGNLSEVKLSKPTTAILFTVGLYSVVGSYPIGHCEFPDGFLDSCKVDPIYLPMSAVRDQDEIIFDLEHGLILADKWSPYGYPTAEFYGIENAGKVYVYQDYLFVNDRFKGTHVFDNSDQSNPKHLAFFRVLGNQDIAIHNHILYLDSYTDIVSINLYQLLFEEPDLSLEPVLPNSKLLDTPIVDNLLAPVRRNREVLDTPIVDNLLPAGAYLSEQIDENGIVIGYRTSNNNNFYFWHEELGQ